MPITGQEAESYITTKHAALCIEIARDKSNKAICFKLKLGSGREFAFDPNQSSKLSIQFDIEPPAISGVEDIEDLSGKSLSTAWHRVFSGGSHSAQWRAKVTTRAALDNVIHYLTTK
ncbi:MAG: hypothetical protein JAZ17_20755 [Candidatus Thiodiazotropha endolucinida]|nr:hypothetical protein [Candidatus Thiodiazotropha endolucinida]